MQPISGGRALEDLSWSRDIGLQSICFISSTPIYSLFNDDIKIDIAYTKDVSNDAVMSFEEFAWLV